MLNKFKKLPKNTALLIIDVQNDFLPGGSLAVKMSDGILPHINTAIEYFKHFETPIFASRDWHPSNHSSFSFWPPHCVQNTKGAEFSSELCLPNNLQIISKATSAEKDAYSAFSETSLHTQLQNYSVKSLVICGLATDYCVLETVLDAHRLGYSIYILSNGIAAVNLKPDDEKNAIQRMQNLGAVFL